MATIRETLAAAIQHHQAGRLEAAEQAYQEILAIEPNHAEALHFLGVVQARMGRHETGVESIRRALAVKPDWAEAHYNLGIVLSGQARWDEAMACYERALELKPCYAEALVSLGNGLRRQRKPQEAIAAYARALERKPDFAEAHNNLGAVWEEQGELDKAIVHYRRAMELKPNYVDAHNNLGAALVEEGRLEEATECYGQALAIEPDNAEVHTNQALLRLLEGDFERGWLEYEWRWRRRRSPPARFRQPLWDGTPAADKTILLHAEQGLGDTIQFVRYASMVKERMGMVFLECQPPLLGLLADFPVDHLVGKATEPLPFDVHAPLLSLPRIFGTTVESVPASVPYLFAAPSLVEDWRKRLSCLTGFKIGIAWQGNPAHRGDRCRSIPLSCFEPLAQVPGVRLISLQKRNGTDQLAGVSEHFPVTDWSESLDEASGPFMDTAALMMNLDLVITSDTAIATWQEHWGFRCGSRCRPFLIGDGCWIGAIAPGTRRCGCSDRRREASGGRCLRRWLTRWEKRRE